MSAATLTPNFDEARRFLGVLDPEGDRFTFQWFDDTPAKDLSKAGHQNLPPDNLKRLVTANRDRCGVFVTVNRTDGKGRTARNVTGVRSVFVDLDGADPQRVHKCELTPHIIVQSSPGRFHAYWLTDDIPLDRFKDLQRRIATRFGGDPAVNDLPRVMRLPGFWHQKGEPFQTRIVEINEGPPYTLEQIEEHLCAPVDERQKAAGDRDPDFRGPGGDLEWEEIIAGLKGDRPGEWHAAMLKAVGNLVARGVTDPVILDLIMPYWATPRSKPYTREAVRKEVQQAIAGARTNGYQPPAWRQDLIVNQDGRPRAILANAITALRDAPELVGLVSLNEFTTAIDLTRPPPWRPRNGAWRDEDDIALANHLSREHGIHVRPNVAREAIQVIAEDRTHHPVRDYLNSLTWDGQARLDDWAIRYLGADDTA